MHPVEKLKSEGRFTEAGRLAFESGCLRSYGCHYGMRSTLQADKAAFLRGYDLAADPLFAADVAAGRA